MIGQRIGYVRVSTLEQKLDRQLENIKVDKVFQDKASAQDIKRPQLEALLSFIREGDTVVVHSMDRLARNLDDLRHLVRTMTQQGVSVEFVKEHLTFTATASSPMATLMLSVMGAFAEFERSLTRERQREGITLAKKRGCYRGRKHVLSSTSLDRLLQGVTDGKPKAELARDLGISRNTLYGYLARVKTNKSMAKQP